jgi:hypothetical protein
MQIFGHDVSQPTRVKCKTKFGRGFFLIWTIINLLNTHINHGFRH